MFPHLNAIVCVVIKLMMKMVVVFCLVALLCVWFVMLLRARWCFDLLYALTSQVVNEQDCVLTK